LLDGARRPSCNGGSTEGTRRYRRPVSVTERSRHEAKLTNPNAVDIIGVKTESGIDNGGRSEDALYFDARHWTPEEEAEAKRFQK